MSDVRMESNRDGSFAVCPTCGTNHDEQCRQLAQAQATNERMREALERLTPFNMTFDDWITRNGKTQRSGLYHCNECGEMGKKRDDIPHTINCRWRLRADALTTTPADALNAALDQRAIEELKECIRLTRAVGMTIGDHN